MTESNNSPWYYDGVEVTPEIIPEYAVGYVYIIEHKLENRTISYVGKKILQSTRRKRIGVREKAATKTRKTYKVEKKDSGWNDYWGSSKTLHAARSTGDGTWRRTIVQWCYSKKNMSYEECRWQFLLDVMHQPSYNDHIGNWYAVDIDIVRWIEHKQKLAEKRASKTHKTIKNATN